jgi:hypothetical protein
MTAHIIISGTCNPPSNHFDIEYLLRAMIRELDPGKASRNNDGKTKMFWRCSPSIFYSVLTILCVQLTFRLAISTAQSTFHYFIEV